VQRPSAHQITAESYAYVRKDLIYVLILALILFGHRALHFVWEAKDNPTGRVRLKLAQIGKEALLNSTARRSVLLCSEYPVRRCGLQLTA